MARTKDWSDLPPELIGKIILKLYELLCQEAGVERDDGDPWRLSSHEIRDEKLLWRCICGAETLRVVCKAWLTAYRDSPSLQICGENRQIWDMPRMAPGVETLIIVEPNDYGMIQISRFLHLRAFHALGYGTDRSSIFDLACLPAHVNILELQGVQCRLDTLQSLKCTEITQARLECLTDCVDDIWQLLQQLPNLQVAEISPAKSRAAVNRGLSKTACTLGRLTALTTLHIGGFLLEIPTATGECPCNLHSLYLIGVVMSAEWLDIFLQGLHCLNILDIEGAEVIDKPLGWQPCLPSSLRKLQLIEWSPLNLPWVPLESLCWEPSAVEAVEEVEEEDLEPPESTVMQLSEARCIMAMKSLIRLGLQNISSHDHEALHHLQIGRLPLLRQLHTCHCGDLALSLMRSGAVPSLEVLSIEASVDTTDRQELKFWELVETGEVEGVTLNKWERACSIAPRSLASSLENMT